MHRIAFAIAALLSIFIIAPASAQVVITQAKALAGNVTPGDTAGYPITITQPGAYRLESNLTVPSGVYGIYIIANNVDLDMNGFTLTGNGTGTWGVISPNGESRIHDGVINRFRYSGIYLRGNIWTIEDMTIARNGSMGVDATDAKSVTVRNSTISTNVGDGLSVGNNGLIVGNNVESNDDGIYCGDVCRVEGNAVSQSKRFGIIVLSGLVLENIVSRSTSSGIYATFGAAAISNLLYYNNAGAEKQMTYVTNVHANTCIGVQC